MSRDACQVLCGVMSGGTWGPNIRQWGSSDSPGGLSHCFLVTRYIYDIYLIYIHIYLHRYIYTHYLYLYTGAGPRGVRARLQGEATESPGHLPWPGAGRGRQGGTIAPPSAG